MTKISPMSCDHCSAAWSAGHACAGIKAAERIAELEAQKGKSEITLQLVSVTRFDDESIWIERHDGEGMQLRITEEWWNNNF